MKKILILTGLILQLAGLAHSQFDDDLDVMVTNPQLTTLAVLIENYLTKTAPESSCALKGLKYQCHYRTREFTVYPRSITGEFSPDAEVVTGPTFIGLKVDLAVKDAPYDGEHSIPKILNEPYWKTYINAYPLKDKTKYLWLDIAYGYQTDKELIEEIKWIIAKYIESEGLYLY